ncbi:MAG: hypothetical protein ACLQVD_17050 [Capsulimonadaceae bacterium]
MIAYIEGEPGGSVVAMLLSDPNATCYAHSINLCEVYYKVIRRSGIKAARAAISSLFTDGVIERHDISRQFWERVGEHKARGKISLRVRPPTERRPGMCRCTWLGLWLDRRSSCQALGW